MKKKLTAAFLALTVAATTAYANDIELFFKIGSFDARLNGSEISSYSYLSEKGNTMVEIRTVSETLGCTVSWYPETREVGISDDGLVMQLKIDSDEAVVNGSTVTMTEAAVIRNDKTLVPIRFVSESFGAEVGYDHETKTVTVRGMTYDGRIKRLKESEAELMTSYYNAVKSWLMVTDTEISAESFSNVWDSLVNTKVMELLPGRAVDAEICEKYRTAAQMSFSDRYTLSSSNGYIMITSKDKEVSFVYNPKARTITLDGKLPPVISYSGGGGSVKPKPTAEPTGTPSASTDAPSASPTIQPDITTQPELTPSPTAAATIKPTGNPGSSGAGPSHSDRPTPPDIEDNPTEKPDKTASPTDSPEPQKTPLPTKPAQTESPADSTEEPSWTDITPEPGPADSSDPSMQPTKEPTAMPTGGPGFNTMTPEPADPSEAPQETAAPEGTDMPEKTAAPEGTDTPQETDVPEETEIPQEPDVPGDILAIVRLKPLPVNSLYMKYHQVRLR